ncbi:hypothetical protein DL93DRAFT_788354 [Clavulina sp. PMI_390]|nr:hypothetical protein DL93DRAFT_788354 [Clavulina sp. PMI_390]
MMIELLRGQSLDGNDTLRESNIQLAKASLLTALALIISAIIQSHKYGLSVFDALILLNLCWIAVIGGLTPMFSIASATEDFASLAHRWGKRPDSLWKRIRRLFAILIDLPRTAQWFNLLYCTFALINGFGLWVMHNPMAFDHSPEACTGTTVFWILGHTINVTSSRFRVSLLTLYSLFLVPGLNILLMFIVWLLIHNPLCFLILVLTAVWQDVMRPGLPYHRATDQEPETTLSTPDSPSYRWFQILAPLPFGIINAILILITRMTMHANTVSSEDQAWHLGQIFGLVIAIFAALSILRQFRSRQNDGENNREGQEMHRLEGASQHDCTSDHPDLERGDTSVPKISSASIRENTSLEDESSSKQRSFVAYEAPSNAQRQADAGKEPAVRVMKDFSVQTEDRTVGMEGANIQTNAQTMDGINDHMERPITRPRSLSY